MIFILLSSILFAKEFSITPYAVISDTSMINENSAILKSLKYPDVIWTLNDSGDSARIFAFNKNDGQIIKPSWIKKYSGIKIYDAHNVDWEAMTYDDGGNILIIDAGNNYNYRRDLTIYKMREPNPYLASEHGIIAKYVFEYPDQKDFPDESNMNFDCEAAFWISGRLCLITKTRSTTQASFYCFNKLETSKVNIPDKVWSFDFKSMVTDASVSPDRKHLAVLSYSKIWIFDINYNDISEIKKSKFYSKDINLGQCEGISFIDNSKMIITNEEGYIFIININDIRGR